MKIFRTLLPALLCLLVAHPVLAQKAGYKYGDVSKDELAYSVCPFDTTADAVIFFKTCKMYFLGGQLNYDIHIRMKVLKESAIDAIATVEIPYYAEENFEEITNLKAQTTNPGSGGSKPVVQRVSNFYEEVVSKQYKIKKFTFSDVGVGSILEYSFTKKSYNLVYPDEWYFDDEYPVLVSQVSADVPGSINYRVIYEGERAFATYAQRPPADWNWVLNNLPALRDEPFSDNILNYSNRIIFQLAGYNTSGSSDGYSSSGGFQEFSISWDMMAKQYLSSDLVMTFMNRGKPVNDALSKAELEDLSGLAKAVKVYNYVRDNFQWDGKKGIYPQQTIGKFADARKGNGAEINLFLVAALKQAGFDAHPAVTGTVEQTRINQNIPNASALDYMVAYVRIQDTDYLLDATGKYYTFNMVDPSILGNLCLVLVPGRPKWVDVENRLRHSGNYSCKANLNPEGVLSLELDLRYTGYKGVSYRRSIMKDGAENWLKKLLENAYPEAKIDSFYVNNLREADLPLDVKIFLSKEVEGDNIFHLYPFRIERYPMNPFTSDTRRTAIYYGYGFDENFATILTFEGWELVSLPENMQLGIPGGAMTFMYVGNKMGENVLQFAIRVNLKSPSLPAQSYKPLQGLYNEMVSKFNEVVVLRRK